MCEKNYLYNLTHTRTDIYIYILSRHEAIYIENRQMFDHHSC
jgi:hypothetical protein